MVTNPPSRYGSRNVSSHNIPSDIVKVIKDRLPPEAWEILDIKIGGVGEIAVKVVRRKDNKLYEGTLNLIGGELELRRVV